MWRDGDGYDAGVFAVGGGGLEALTEAAVGVDEGERTTVSPTTVDASLGVEMAHVRSPEDESEVEGSSDAIQRAACRSIKPGCEHFDPKNWKHPSLPKPLKPGLVNEVKRRCPEVKCDNWRVPKLAAWLHEHAAVEDSSEDDDEEDANHGAAVQMGVDLGVPAT